MTINLKSVVAIHYTLRDDSGVELESTHGSEPVVYLQGAGNIARGLELALLGKQAGDSFTVIVEPQEGYGERVPELVQTAPRAIFEDQEISVGMRFSAGTDTDAISFIVKEVKDEEVVVDGNHPLAGKTLKYDISVESIREATEEELIHGHVHQLGGHCC